jgi:hypothetical protein
MGILKNYDHLICQTLESLICQSFVAREISFLCDEIVFLAITFPAKILSIFQFELK